MRAKEQACAKCGKKGTGSIRATRKQIEKAGGIDALDIPLISDGGKYYCRDCQDGMEHEGT